MGRPDLGTHTRDQADKSSHGHSSNPDQVNRCYICRSSSDQETPRSRRISRRPSTGSAPSNSALSSSAPSSSAPRRDSTSSVTGPATGPGYASSLASEETVTFESEDSDTDPESGNKSNATIVAEDDDVDCPLSTSAVHLEKAVEAITGTSDIAQTPESKQSGSFCTDLSPSFNYTGLPGLDNLLPATLASQVKQSTPKQPAHQQTPSTTPNLPSSGAAEFTRTTAEIPLPPTMLPSQGPVTRLQAQNAVPVDGGHRQISTSFIEEGNLDQTFKVSPKWHYIKSNHEETSGWLQGASFESILLELLYFAHDQGRIQQKELEVQFEKELEKAIDSIEKLDCLDAFCKTFVREGRFRPTGKVVLAPATKDDKNSRLFRMINADLLSLQKQQRILSMVCSGTADHDVHTQAHRENLRKLVEDLVHVVHPGDRGTLSEVSKFLTEHAVSDQRHVMKQQLSSVKLVSLPDIMVPYGGPVYAGGVAIPSGNYEQKIRAKMPSMLIKMHFSDRGKEQKWGGLSRADDSGMGSTMETTINEDPSITSTPTGTGSSGRTKGKTDKADDKAGVQKAGSTGSTASSTSRSGKRKPHEDSPGLKSKRHREDINSGGYDTQPPEAHVINEIYSEHVAQLLCSLAQTPQGYLRPYRHAVSPLDERDGSASASVLGMIVSGEDIYLTKLDASHDYLDSLVETFRMDQLSFSCLANPLNLYKGAHIKALLMFLRYACLNFPRTTFFMSD